MNSLKPVVFFSPYLSQLEETTETSSCLHVRVRASVSALQLQRPNQCGHPQSHHCHPKVRVEGESYSSAYRPYHVSLVTLASIVGIAANSIHIFVLTRPSMRTTSVNRLVSGRGDKESSQFAYMSLAEIILLVTYGVYVFRFYVFQSIEDEVGYPYIWMAFLIFYGFARFGLEEASE